MKDLPSGFRPGEKRAAADVESAKSWGHQMISLLTGIRMVDGVTHALRFR
jgi:hypothetical protein